MQRNRIMPANKLFYQILLYFLSLLIPIAVIGVVTYANFVAKYKHDFIENATKGLEISAGQLDAHLRTVQEAGISFFSDIAVSRLLKPDREYTLEDRASLVDILQSLKRTSAILTEFAGLVFMYIDHDKVYTTSGIEDFDAFFQRAARYDEFAVDYWKRSSESGRDIELLKPSLLHTEQTGERVVPVVVSRLVRGYRAVLVTNISVNDLQRKLKGYAPFDSTQFVALDAYNRLVFGPEQQAAAVPALLGKLAESFPSGEPGSTELTMGDTSYIASYVQSDLYGWKLYALTPVSEFNRQASGIWGMIVVICIVLVVIGVLFSFIFTFKLYTPIQRIKDVLSDHKEPVDAPGAPANDFDEIGLGINRLIRHNLTFERQLDSVRVEYADQALLLLLKDRETADAVQLEQWFRERFGFTKDRYRCIGIHFEFKEAFYAHIPDEERLIVWSKLKKLIRGFLSRHFRLHVLEMTRHLYLCVMEPDDAGKDEAGLRQALESFMQTFQFDLQFCTVRAGIGKVHQGIGGVADSYKEAMVALQHCDGRRDCEIVPYDRLPVRPSVMYTFTDEMRLLNLLKAGDPALKAKIRQIIAQQEQDGLSSPMVGMFITDVYRTGLRFAMEQGLEPRELLDEERHRLLNDSEAWPPRVELKKASLFVFYDRLADELEARQQTFKTNAHISAIMDMIENEYDRDLYLESISDRLGVSPKYVSRIFKEKTGMNITQYLNIVRVDQAKRLLASTRLPIGEIADKVGIGNRTTFLRVFKKTEGMSLQSYRNGAMRGQDDDDYELTEG
ncbi:HTH-type transcriptional activator RhaR [Paenibacillus solanacearum]|uniref:HTH-type transcriptional activator RhaR n=1 Tax=Paenibacillus solanacearum TaxID=2048548 RepID=A0A916K602_9BACL|nr:helix-turn-helix domain-containing protein [Paenibacillus solanacearum]CAG7636588.1 HTH-type transcriptional activator RhaR [Paenibacillus solanacearum]